MYVRRIIPHLFIVDTLCPNFLKFKIIVFRTVPVFEKYEVGLFMVLGFGWFSVLIALFHNGIRKYVYGDSGSLDTMFDAGGKVSLSLTAVTVTSQALWPLDFIELPMITYLVCHVNLKMFFIQVHILTSNGNATPKCTSISQGYIEYTFSEDFWGFYEYERQTPY